MGQDLATPPSTRGHHPASRILPRISRVVKRLDPGFRKEVRSKTEVHGEKPTPVPQREMHRAGSRDHLGIVGELRGCEGRLSTMPPRLIDDLQRSRRSEARRRHSQWFEESGPAQFLPGHSGSSLRHGGSHRVPVVRIRHPASGLMSRRFTQSDLQERPPPFGQGALEGTQLQGHGGIRLAITGKPGSMGDQLTKGDLPPTVIDGADKEMACGWQLCLRCPRRCGS